MICNKVLLVEDEKDVREAAKVTLELEDFDVTEVDSAVSALAVLSGEWRGVVVTDVRMPGMDGMDLLLTLRKLYPDLPVILVTGHGDVSMALSAIRSGAYDFIEKPVAPELLIDVVKRAMQTQTLILENKALRNRLADVSKLEGRIIGSSTSMISLRELVHNLAEADIDVLIHGETGTGKELIARALHDFGDRKGGQFVALNCGALPESVIESELFGHEAGAFTGATKRRIGKIEYSAGGTLFLDEIESMALHLQVKLLRVLQERVIERLGGNATIPVDIRVIAATKSDLLGMAKQGTFRDDFYYRLSVAQLEIPPLRERLGDIPMLFTHFVQLAADRLKKEMPNIEARHIDDLTSRKWEGNVRELRNVAERFVLGISRRLTGGSRIDQTCPEGEFNLDDQMAIHEQRFVEAALARNKGRITETADELGIPRKKLYLRMKRFGIDKTKFKDIEN